MASIIVTSGEHKGEYLPLGRRTSVIGRDEALSLQILDRLVSRKHLRISFDKVTNRFQAEDMKSKHGVSISGRKISDLTALSDGDEILIGNTTLLFTDEDFDDRESALTHYKERGQRDRRTVGDSRL
jgi:pSer/pThr/pTyr-binding forkhead associated (FHA) protein